MSHGANALEGISCQLCLVSVLLAIKHKYRHFRAIFLCEMFGISSSVEYATVYAYLFGAVVETPDRLVRVKLDFITYAVTKSRVVFAQKVQTALDDA